MLNQCANLLGVYGLVHGIAYFSGWPIFEIFSRQTLQSKKSDDFISIYVHDLTIRASGL